VFDVPFILFIAAFYANINL